MNGLRLLGLAAALALPPAACGGEPDLVVYCCLDQEYSEPILELFEQRTGLKVAAHFDGERLKTVGVVNKIIAERQRPQGDVFWNNEIAHTIRLKNLGLTAPYQSEMTRGLPEAHRDPEGHWYGFAARARVIAYREDLGQAPPQRLDQMLEPEFAAHGGMAAPITGTTLTHFTALAVARGVEPVHAWLQRAKGSGLQIGGGNADVMRRVGEKDIAWCLTDTDDAAAAQRNGHPIRVLYPDQGPGESGTVLIPNSVCILTGARHRAAAEQFLDFVTSPEVEARLAASGSRQIPLRPGIATGADVAQPGRDFRAAAVDWAAVAAAIETRARAYEELFVQ